MNVLIATDVYYPQIIGSSYAVYNLALGLRDRGHRVVVLAPLFPGRNHKEEMGALEVYRFTSLPIPYMRDIRTALTPISIFERIRRLRPDIIHIHHPFLIGRSALFAARRFSIPVVITNHLQPESFLMFSLKGGTFDKYERGLRFTWKFIVGFCNRGDFVTSPTEAAVNLLKAHGLRVRAQAVSNGLDLRRFNPNNDGEYLRRRWSIPSLPIVLYTGRLSEEKRVDVLIRAIPYVINKLNAHFVITGDGPIKRALEGLAQEYGVSKHITFTGFLNHKDYPNIYAVADLFVMPSLCELQSISTLEALASGLPVVAANRYALPETVIPGENGLLFEPANSKDLADKIVAILSNKSLRERMQKSGLRLIRRHSLDRVLKEYENIYQREILHFTQDDTKNS